MAFDVEGKLHKKFDTEQKTDSFRAREFVIEIASGQYPQMIKFQLTQDKCDLLDAYNEGDDLSVHFDLRGREWNGKYFTNLNAWRVDSASSSQQNSMPDQRDVPPPAEPDNRDYDEVPF